MKKALLPITLLAAAALLISCKSDKAANDQTPKSTPTITAAVTASAGNKGTSEQELDNGQKDTSGEFKETTLSVSGWEITIENVIRDDTMNNASVVLGYTDATTNEYEVKAQDGYDYFLVKMKLSKKESKENIEWDKMTLTDSVGNVYNRIDDIFISDLGMKRLPGTTLNFGSSEGWIAFEIKKDAKGLTLTYDFTDEDLHYSFAD